MVIGYKIGNWLNRGMFKRCIKIFCYLLWIKEV